MPAEAGGAHQRGDEVEGICILLVIMNQRSWLQLYNRG